MRMRRTLLAASVIWSAVNAVQTAEGALTFNVGGTWDTDARKNAAIAALTAVCNRYNAYGNFGSYNIYGYYSSGIPTAQASYLGSIGYGGTYPNERVTLHESNHYLGSGTYSTSNGKNYAGPRATAIVEQFEGIGEVINHDTAHFWPYGMNYDTEWSEINAQRNIALMYALRGDWGIGSTANPTAWAATTVAMDGDDALGTSAFNYGSTWSDNTFAHYNADYSTGNFLMRTPASANGFTFAGASLTVNNTTGISDGLLYKGSGTTGVITINNLTLDGGYVRHASGTADVFQLAGNSLTILQSPTIDAAQGNIKISSTLLGNGTLNVPSTGFAVTLRSPNSTFNGNIVANGRLELSDTGNQRFTLGVNGVNNAISGTSPQTKLNGRFDIDLSNANLTTGNSWQIVSTSNTSYGSTFTVTGMVFDAGVWTNRKGQVFNPSTGRLSAVAVPTTVTWNGNTSSSMNAAANWTAASPVTGNSIVFGAAGSSGTALTDNLMTPGTRTIAGITFNSGAPAYTLNGATASNGFSLSSGIFNNSTNLQTIDETIAVPSSRTNFGTRAGGGDLLVSKPITGAGSIAKVGAGTLTLSATNTYTGGTRVDEGELVLTGVLSTSGALTMAGGSFTYSRAGTNSQTFSGLSVYSGFGAVRNPVATNTMVLGGITRFTDGTINFADLTGTITTTATNTNGILGPWAVAGSGTGARYAYINGTTVAAFTGATAAGNFGYATDGTANYDVAGIGGPFGAARDANTVRYTGPAGNVQSNAANTYTFNGLMNAGTGVLAIGGGSFDLHVAAGSTGELVLAAMSAGITLNDAVDDGTAGTDVIAVGPNTIILAGPNTYTGKTTIAGGTTVQIGAGSTGARLSSSLVNNDGALVFNHTDAFTVSSSLAGGGTLTKTGTGTLTLTGLSSITGNTSISAGVLTIGDAGALAAVGSYDGSMSIATSASFISDSTATQAIGGVISGAGQLQLASGMLTLSGANTYSGTTSLISGTLAIGNNAAFGTGTVDLRGAAVQSSDSTLRTIANPISVSSSTAFNGTGNLLFTGAVNAGSLAKTLTVNNPQTEFSGIISGSGARTKDGSGTLVFSGNNTYTGTTTISAGTLQLGNGGTTGKLATGSAIVNNGTLAFNRSNTMTQGTDFNSAITGTGGVSQIGSGTVVLSGTNSYTGPTQVSSGVLNLTGTYSPAAMSSTATLGVTGGGSVSIAGTANFYAVSSPARDLTVNGTLNIKSASTSDVSTVQKLTGTGTVALDKGTLNSTSGLAVKTLNITGGGVVKINPTDADGAGAGMQGSAAGVSRVSNLSIGSTSKLDLSNNGLTIPATGTLNGSTISVSALRTAIIAGRGGTGTGNATWSGAGGVGSSAFNFDETASSLGYVWLGDPNLLVPPATLNGQSFSAGDYLVKFTAGADADLDGLVDDTDVAVIGLTYDGGSTSGHHWYEGDFNYDGRVNDDDVAIIGLAYNPTGSPLSPNFYQALSSEFGQSFATAFATGAAVVPEPASVGLLAIGAIGLLRRQRLRAKRKATA